jgi:hypothetical protein
MPRNGNFLISQANTRGWSGISTFPWGAQGCCTCRSVRNAAFIERVQGYHLCVKTPTLYAKLTTVGNTRLYGYEASGTSSGDTAIWGAVPVG